MKEEIIAIDGPAGSGKSSVAREISIKIGYHYLDSGAYYRAITLFFLISFQSQTKEKNFPNWLSDQDMVLSLEKIKLDCVFSNRDENTIFLNGEDVSLQIRDPSVTEKIKYLAIKKEIRDFVNFRIRSLAEKNLLILDGRDIGTEVFPESKFKFFLTANVDTRATRRFKELSEKGFQPDFEKLKNEIIQRDNSDSEREIAPLKKAPDAFLIDTSGLSKDVVIRTIISELQNKGLSLTNRGD